MLLPENGPIISVLSSEIKFVQEIELLYENLFKSVPITLCHPGGNIDEKNLAWIVSMMRFSDTIYLDLDSVTELGVVCALTQKTNNVIIISKTSKRKGMQQLLNTMRKYNIYDSIQDYADLMLDSLETV